MMDHKKCTQEMGGEVARIIDFLNNKPFLCDCGSVLRVDNVVNGYPHDGGYADKEGKKWWLYLTCHQKDDHYDWALWKVVRRIRDFKQKQENGGATSVN